MARIQPKRHQTMARETPKKGGFRRYCKTLALKDDPLLIAEYRRAHEGGAVWPEITGGMKEVGILDMEIYLSGNRLFMIMETVPEFDHDAAMKELAGKPRQKDWEEAMSVYQETSSGAPADEKWTLMERIFKLDG